MARYPQAYSRRGNGRGHAHPSERQQHRCTVPGIPASGDGNAGSIRRAWGNRQSRSVLRCFRSRNRNAGKPGGMPGAERRFRCLAANPRHKRRSSRGAYRQPGLLPDPRLFREKEFCRHAVLAALVGLPCAQPQPGHLRPPPELRRRKDVHLAHALQESGVLFGP